MEVLIYDTMSGNKVPVPNNNHKVGIYVCGLTVYDRAHLGHARVFVVFDVFRRILAKNGYDVRYVQNFTDVDDRIILKAKELGVSTKQIADQYIAAYFDDAKKLNVIDADVYPRATEHINDILALIKKIEDKGYAYVTSKGVYFRVSKFKQYGKLSHQSVDNLKSGARVEPDPEKEYPLDFSLWKFYKGDPVEPRWDSEWGPGRPGWHIECSAMSMKYLGVIDVHGGGADLIFPHHENEIAQSEAATDQVFARSWMHVGLLSIEGEKMSKSLKNFITIDEAVKRWGGNAVRLFLLSTPYRSALSYSEVALERSADNWLQIEATYAEALCPRTGDSVVSDEYLIKNKELEQRLIEYLADDLNTPAALNAIFQYFSYLAKVSAEGDGLNERQAELVIDNAKIIEEMLGFTFPRKEYGYEELIFDRFELRRQKKYAEADAIRNKLRQDGLLLIDHKDHTIWFKSSVPDAGQRIARAGPGFLSK